MLNARRLHLLAELRRLGTLADVAAELSYSPSAVSQQLAQLEREAGVPLLEKDGRRVRLTDAGQLLADRADEVLHLLERAETDLAAQRNVVSGTLRVATFDTALLTVMPAALAALGAQHPDLHVHVSQREVETALAGLLAQEFDVIVGEEYPGLALPPHPGVHRQDVLADRMLLVLPDRGPWAHVDRVSDLGELTWALDEASNGPGTWERGALRELGVEPRVAFEITNPLLQINFVRSGLAASLIPELVGVRNLAGTRLRTLPGSPRRRLYTACRSGRAHHPAIVAFQHHFRQAARDSLDADQAPGDQPPDHPGSAATDIAPPIRA